MMKVKLGSFFLLMFFINFQIGFARSFPANEIVVSFQYKFKDQQLILTDSPFYFIQADSIQIKTFKYYVSKVEFWNKNKLVLKEKNSFHLINLEDSNSLHFSIKSRNADLLFDKLKFDLGIDSSTNMKGAMAGDLDPTKGMYWTWQSGFINWKLEGTNSAIHSPKNDFQLHVGGFKSPYNTLQVIELSVNNKKQITIDVDLEKAFSIIDFNQNSHVMSPSENAVTLSHIFAKIFSFKK